MRRGRRLSILLVTFGCLVALLVLPGVRFSRSLLGSLPETGVEGSAFEHLIERFGLDRALAVGVAPSGGLFQPEGMRTVRELAEKLRESPAVAGVDSIATATDLREVEGALEAVDAVPATVSDWDALRRRLCKHPLIGGSLVSRDGRAAMMLVTLKKGLPDPAGSAREIARLVRANADGAAISFDGALFRIAESAAGLSHDGRLLLASLLLFSLIGLLVARRSVCSQSLRLAGAFLLAAWCGLLVAALRGMAERPVTPVELAAAPVSMLLLFPLFLACRRAADSRAMLGGLVVVGGMVEAARSAHPAYAKSVLAAAVVGAILLVWHRLRFADARCAPARPSFGSAGVVFVGGMAVVCLLFIRPARLPKAGDRSVFCDHFKDGGTLIVSIPGDPKRPSVVARLLRLEEEMKAHRTGVEFRSLADAVAFLGARLGDGWRVPVEPGKFNNLMFFLDGVPEVVKLARPDELLLTVTLPPGAEREALVRAEETVARFNRERFLLVPRTASTIALIEDQATRDLQRITALRAELLRRLLVGPLPRIAVAAVVDQGESRFYRAAKALGMAEARALGVASSLRIEAGRLALCDDEPDAALREMLEAEVSSMRLDVRSRAISEQAGGGPSLPAIRGVLASSRCDRCLIGFAGGVPEAASVATPATTLRAGLTGEAVVLRAAGRELVRTMRREGILLVGFAVCGLLLAGGGFRRLLPLALPVAALALAGPDLSGVGMLPAFGLATLLLLLGSDGKRRDRLPAAVAFMLALALCVGAVGAVEPEFGSASALLGVVLIGEGIALL